MTRINGIAIKEMGQRWLFVLLTTAVFVIFSEKAYWYPHGYAIGELILFYAFPVYATLWAIDYFRVRTLPLLILPAALFAFLVEGVLTPVIYEAGLLDPIMPAYFIGWHGLLAVIFGWYLLRKWLVAGHWRSLLVGSILFGLLWGVWSITFWLPDNVAEPTTSAVWSVAEFASYTFLFTLLLAICHWLLGQGSWQPQFRPSRLEAWFVGLVLLFFFATLAFPAAPLGIVKLGGLLTAVFLPLNSQRKTQPKGSLLANLNRPIHTRHLLTLFAMPLVATSIYALALRQQPAEETIRAIVELLPLAQGLIGLIWFAWAILYLLFRKHAQAPNSTTPVKAG